MDKGKHGRKQGWMVAVVILISLTISGRLPNTSQPGGYRESSTAIERVER